MKIEIKDLGPISRFSFDLNKDFHIVFGKNSIGKSYAIYCIYILLKKITEVRNRNFRFNDTYENSAKEDYNKQYYTYRNSVTDLIRNSKEEKITIKNDLENILTHHFNNILADDITESFRNTFYSLADLKNFYSNKKPEIKLISKDLAIIIHLNRSNYFAIKKVQLFDNIYIVKKKRSKVDIYINDEKQVLLNSTSIDDVPELLLSICSTNFFRNVYREVNSIYFLPSSRSGLYLALSSFGPIIAELSKSRFQLKRKIELPSISEPISDYFIPLANINSKRVSKTLTTITSKIEKEILHGNVSIDNENNRIVFQPDNTTLKLDLSVTSSMISEIAPIVTYLKHVIGGPETMRLVQHSTFGSPSEKTIRTIQKNRSIIFIEEPEAHLHPEAQILLTEIFADLSMQGIKVVITSHSNYMFNKLVNLILSKKIQSKDVAVLHMEMTPNGSIVKEDMEANEDGIEDYNFAEESEKLYEERIDILEKKNEE